MIMERLAVIVARPMDALVRLCAKVSPDFLTLSGLALNAAACACFALAGDASGIRPNLLRVGGGVALFAALFDMLDGRVARLRGRGTHFGAYLDSTMDRYSDGVLFMGLMMLYARLDSTSLMVLCWVAAFGSFMTSYARARAESLIDRCGVGLIERPERIVLLVLGAIANRMVGALWIIAVLSNLTALQRVIYTYFELKQGWGDSDRPS